MSIKLKDIIHMQKMQSLVITPSGKEYRFYTDHTYPQGSVITEMTAEKAQILEAERIKMETHNTFGFGAVFYITEPETKPKTFTVEESTKISSEIIYVYQEKFAYALKPSEKMKKSVKEDFDIYTVEVLPKSMYAMEINHLSVDPITGMIEAYLD